MAFPTTGVLDNFNRADEGPPPSANWTDTWTGLGGGTLVNSNELGTPFYGDSYWSASTFGPNSEVYVTIAYWDYTYYAVRLQDPGTSYSCYRLDHGQAEESETFLSRVDGGFVTQLGAYLSAATAGTTGKVGIEASGTSISMYEDAGGGWSLVGTRTDGTYTAAGYIGVGFGTASGLLDDFGGGTIAAAPTAPFAPNRLYRTAVRTASTW
jgi:hypothetical protein